MLLLLSLLCWWQIKLLTSALWQEGKSSAAWMLDKASMTLKLQTVQVATSDNNETVISNGLRPGMMADSGGMHLLSWDQKVTIYEEKAPTSQ